jgi:hypothetical protein
VHKFIHPLLNWGSLHHPMDFTKIHMFHRVWIIFEPRYLFEKVFFMNFLVSRLFQSYRNRVCSLFILSTHAPTNPLCVVYHLIGVSISVTSKVAIIFPSSIYSTVYSPNYVVLVMPSQTDKYLGFSNLLDCLHHHTFAGQFLIIQILPMANDFLMINCIWGDTPLV